MRKNMTIILILALMVMLFTTVGQCATNQKVYNWDFYVFSQLDQGYGVYLVEFANNVKERSEGRLVITCRAPGELPYQGQDALHIAGDRSVELADAVINYLGGDIKTGLIPSWPFLCSSTDDFVKAMEIVQPYMVKRAKEFGAEGVFWYIDPAQRYWGKGEPISKLSDLKNIKVRTSSIQQQIFLNSESIKAIPVAMPSTEVPTSMTRNVIQAAITGAFWANESKWNEFIDWGYIIPFSFSGRYVLVNSEALAELPDDLKEILFEEGQKAQEIMIKEIPLKDLDAIEELRKNGVQIIEPDPDDIKRGIEIMKPYWIKWAEEIGPEGEKVLAEIIEALDKK